MTRFHTDEYIDFLQRVAPDTADELTGKGTRCEFHLRSIRPKQNLTLLPRAYKSLGRRRQSSF
jgi:hypothetical protein